jgi:predicted HicB family RNase H-like nuclease
MSEKQNGVVSDIRERNGIYQVAYELYRQDPDWVTFYREILGLDGLVRQTYQRPEALARFERSETYAEILGLLTRLRERPLEDEDVLEPVRVVTVRVPRSVHEALREEAHERRTSMNQLCISKLVQFIEKDLIPNETWRLRSRRRRKPAEQKGAGVDL